MTQSLRERAQANGTAQDAKPVDEPPGDQLVPFAELSEPTSDDPPQVSVFVAWARVMRDVQGVAKKGLYNASGTRYNFRGVDAMINAFGPACRKHGVIVVPHKVSASHAEARSTKDKAMRETTTVVTWHVYGPDGTFFEGESEGESLDSSDKGAAKAQSVALRAFLIAAGLVPTDEPDPDSVRHERGERPLPKAGDYVEEVCNPNTSPARLRQIWVEVKRHHLFEVLVENEVGDDEKLGLMIERLAGERSGK